MAKRKLLEANDIYRSTEPPKSKVLASSWINRLNSLFGFRTATKGSEETEFEKKYGIKLVKVDLDNAAYRVKNAALGSIFKSANLTEQLEKYFDSYLKETTLSYNDIQDRQRRLNELSFAYYNDCFISRVVHLCADEATQLDQQNRLISIDSPNLAFVQRCYELLADGELLKRDHIMLVLILNYMVNRFGFIK